MRAIAAVCGRLMTWARGRREAPRALAHEADPEVRVHRWQHSAVNDSGALAWPEDPDEVPAWRLEREDWARGAGVILPGYRTRREFEAVQAALAPPEVAPVPVPLPVPDHTVEFRPADAARAFLMWLRQDDMTGEYSAAEINALYDQWCADRGCDPAKVDLVKEELLLLPGVWKGTSDTRNGGRRQRRVRWIIDCDVPFPEIGETGPATEDPPFLKLVA